jgi:hypothetical protein
LKQHNPAYRFVISLIFLLFIGGWNAVSAQYWTPQNIQDRYKTGMVIRNYRELVLVKENLKQYIHIERLRIDGDVDVNTVTQLVAKMPWVDELQLIRFQGILSDVDLKNLEWVPSIYLYVPKDREDALLLNDQWKNISNITLQFQEVPEQWDFLKDWKNCQSLTVLASLNKTDAQNLIQQVVVSIPQIQRLGVSLSTIKHLPNSVKNLNHLKELSVINSADVEIRNPDASGTQMNNSDVLMGLVYNELGRETIPIEVKTKHVAVSRGGSNSQNDKSILNNFEAGVVEMPIFVPFHYIAAEPILLASDLKYIYELYPNSPKDPNISWLTEENSTVDFAEFTLLNRQKLSAKYGIQKQTFVNDYNDGIYEFEGKSDKDETFFGEGKWAVLIPKNSLISKGRLQQIQNQISKSENLTSASVQSLIEKSAWKNDYRLIVKTSQSPERNAALGKSFQYDSSGKLFLLDAGVWFEISATSLGGDIPLDIRPGYFAQINYQASVRDSSRFYAYNIPRKKWVNYYDYDYDFEDDFVSKIDFYQFNAGSNTSIKHSETPVLNLDEMFETAGFHYVLSPTESKTQLNPIKGNYVIKSASPIGNNSYPLFRGRSTVRVRVLGQLKMTDVVGIEISDVSAGKLYPELKSLEGQVFYIHTKASRKYVIDFFKSQRIIDVRIKKYGESPQLEFKTDQSIIEISCLSYYNLPTAIYTDKEKIDLQRKWDLNFSQYQNRRILKNQYWVNWRTGIENQRIAQASESVLGNSRLQPGMKRGSFKIRSMGEYVMAKPVALNPTHYLELVFCDAGKIPLKCTDVLVVLEQPQSSIKLENPNKNATSATDAPRYKLQINPKQITSILVKTQSGNVFYLTGDAFRKLNLADNTISYVSMQPLPDKVYNSEILANQLGIKQKKTKPAPSSK